MELNKKGALRKGLPFRFNRREVVNACLFSHVLRHLRQPCPRHVLSLSVSLVETQKEPRMRP